MGSAVSAAERLPVNCAEVVYPVVLVSDKPLILDVAAGPRPRSPVIEEMEMLLIADLASIT